jgi:integrase
MAGGDVMTADLRAAMGDYLSLRRSLGYGLWRDAKLLAQFITYLEQRDTTVVTTADALTWARLPANASAGWWGFRLSVVRSFASYLRTLDPATEVPPAGLLPGRGRRAVPYLYSDTDIGALFAQAEQLATPLRRLTIQTVIGLLAVTGLRIGELLAVDDVDVAAGLLTVRHGKFGKVRQIPLHQSSVAAIEAYRRLRDAKFTHPVSPALLVSEAGTRLLNYNVGQTFARLVRRAGLVARSPACRPRPHDLRHSFAVHTLLDWYRDGGDIATRMPLLSTYLGHVSPANTYWYLHAAPELMAEAARRLDAMSGELP